jgi:Family of unknown function (DUF6152)
VRLAYGVAACALLNLAAARAAFAHHSFAMYDSQQVITIKGVVKEFQWSNPHAIVWLLSGPSEGEVPELWTIELPTSPAGLVRMGWDKRSLNPGDRVIVEINPLRNGKHAGSFKKATLVDSGKILTVAAPGAAQAPTEPKP